MTNHEATIQKVRKLLAMAERSPHASEADAFSRKAAELIAAHRIDPERLRAETHDELRVRTFDVGRGAYVRARIALLQAIAEAHGCRLVFAPARTGTVAYVAGFRSDLEAVELLYASLHTQASSRMSRERRPTAAATQRFRRSFLLGFADEVQRMLTRTRATAERAAVSAETTLPALRAREQRVEDFARSSFGRVVAARRVSPASAAGWDAGRAAAARADLGRRGMDGPRALGRGA